MATQPVGDYWNHNTAYHPWLMRVAGTHRGDVLDVGCGDGLLAQRLAPLSRSVTAVEPDPSTAQRALRRLGDQPNVDVVGTSFERFDPGMRRFDLVTFVASLHHMPLRSSLTRARDLLTPTGEVAVVGLSANTSAWDWLVVGMLPTRGPGRWPAPSRDTRHRCHHRRSARRPA
jgi:2-polyprenyl-3-methyl-5-hydroxy-6-metoxy-1,4-benzoquinol methylase